MFRRGFSAHTEVTLRCATLEGKETLTPARCAVTHANYQHTSAPLSEEVRQSLLEDLELSEEDRIVEK